MKKLGILGGMGPESTLLYYREIANEFKKKDEKGYFPELTIETVNMYKMLAYCTENKYDSLADYLLQGIHNLERAGVDFVVLASNTPHVVFDTLEKKANIPLLSIVEPVCKEVMRNGLINVAWLGTNFTMTQPYFKKMFLENDITVTVPDTEKRAFIDKVIADELEFGIVNPNSKKIIDSIIQEMILSEGVEAIILGCTELPLMYSKQEFSVPIFDTLKCHIQGILEWMFKE